METRTIDRINEAEKLKEQGRFSTRKLRFWAQVFALSVTLWIGIEFILFVKYLESGGNWSLFGLTPGRPPGVEAFLPLSALISVREWFQTGVLNSIHPSSVIILLAIIGVSFLFKKGFCSWVCPVGFISEMIGNVGDWLASKMHTLLGQKPVKKNGAAVKTRLKLPKFLDFPLRSLKYLLLAFFVYAIFWSMSSTEIHQFVTSPYNKVADIKMLKFFIQIDAFALWTIIILFALSIFLRGFWCRYLCPYGALLGLFSLVGPAKIRRDDNCCISCGKCTGACPAFIKVDQTRQVISDECSGCLDCVDVCPAKGALELTLTSKVKPISKMKWAISVLIIFWGILVLFKITGPWQNTVTTEEYLYHVEKIEGVEYNHPGR
jgi:polyferredoxin